MGEIAEMMLDGTMDPETGEFNFDGQDGPGWPMTGAEAAAYRRAGPDRRSRRRDRGPRPEFDGETRYTVTKKARAKIEAFGALKANDAYHWQVRKDGKLVADWWPHRSKFRIDGKALRGNEADFIRALTKVAGTSA